jgi:hypothetical protein
MSLTEAEFTTLVESACDSCGSTEIVLRSYVTTRFTLLGGEAYGAQKFIHKGEDLARGVYRADCGSCKKTRYESDACPACKQGSVAAALAASDAQTRPLACPQCNDEQVAYLAWLPVTVKANEGRPEKARTLTQLDDEGCHGVRVECKECLYSEPLPKHGGCLLCGHASGGAQPAA